MYSLTQLTKELFVTLLLCFILYDITFCAMKNRNMTISNIIYMY